MKETILKILGNKYNQRIDKKWFLLNCDGEEVNLKTDKSEIYSDENFRLYVNKGEVILETTYSNQLITDEWIVKFNDLQKIKFTIEKIYL